MTRSFGVLALLESFNYASVQYILPRAIADEIRHIREHLLPQEDLVQKDDATYTPHVTIFYGLSDRDNPVVSAALQGFGALEYTIQGMPGIFDTAKHNVLYLPVVSPQFHRAHMHIRRWTGKEPPTYRDYTPHVTIAYLKKDAPTAYSEPFFGQISGTATEFDFHLTKDIPTRIPLI